MTAARSRLIVALDLPDRKAALEMLARLHGRAGCFKVGLELFVREGPRLVEEIRALGADVFLDLKLHDIPNTVAAAVRSASSLGARMLTVHVSGGVRMLAAARAAAETGERPPLLLGVTALTSLADSDADQLGIGGGIAGWVERLGRLASEAGLGGLVASPLETARLRARFPAMKLVVPGIRPSGADSGDQARTAAPLEAIRAGADYLVVGRPILQAADPAAAAERIVAEIAEALPG